VFVGGENCFTKATENLTAEYRVDNVINMKRLMLWLVLVFSTAFAWAQEPSGQQVEVTAATVVKTAPGEAKAKVVFSAQRPQSVESSDDEELIEMGADEMEMDEAQ